MNISKDLIDAIKEEVEIRFRMLCVLYGRRREDPQSGMMTTLQIQQALEVDGEKLFFATWYLRIKKLVAINDRSAVHITTEGIDYLEEQISRFEAPPLV